MKEDLKVSIICLYYCRTQQCLIYKLQTQLLKNYSMVAFFFRKKLLAKHTPKWQKLYLTMTHLPK